MELLSPKRVLSFRSIREEEVSNLIGWISSNAGLPINLAEKIYASTYNITCRAAFCKKSNDQEAFIPIIKESVKLAAGFNVADIYSSVEWLHFIGGTKSKLEKMHKEADRIIGNMIEMNISRQGNKHWKM